METKALLLGIIGFMLGGLTVSVAASQLENDEGASTGMTMTQMTGGLQNKTGDEFDEAFIASMIEHHQGAIDMAKLADKQAKHEEVKQMAREILDAQSREIDMMRTWQSDWGYASTMSHSDMGR